MTSAEKSAESSGVVHLDERMLLRRHLNGDPEAFAELVAQYRAPVYGYLLRSGIEPTRCDDLFQEIFLKIHRGAATYQPEKPLKPWIFAIAANTLRSWFRKKSIPFVSAEDGGVEDVVDGAPSSQQMVEAHETVEWLEDALSKLSPTQRQVVILCCIEKLEQKDVAAVLEIPVNTVKTHLRRARIALARALARRRARGSREVAS